MVCDPIDARLLLSGLDPSIFMLSARQTWYFRDSFSSNLADKGDAAPRSGETSLGGVGGKLKRCWLEWDPEVSEDTVPVLAPLLPGYTADKPPGAPVLAGWRLCLVKWLTAQALW